MRMHVVSIDNVVNFLCRVLRSGDRLDSALTIFAFSDKFNLVTGTEATRNGEKKGQKNFSFCSS